MNVLFNNTQLHDLLSTFPGLEPNHMFFQLNTSEQQLNLMKIFLVNLEIGMIQCDFKRNHPLNIKFQSYLLYEYESNQPYLFHLDRVGKE